MMPGLSIAKDETQKLAPTLAAEEKSCMHGLVIEA